MTVSIKGYLAEVTSTLKYSNEDANPVEAVYTFPVDDASAVYEFQAAINGRIIAAEIQEKEQVKVEYYGS